ncbi:MAG: hypothetical protein ACE5F7_07310 [Nitrospiria bacterium]
MQTVMPSAGAADIQQVEGLNRVGPRDLTYGYPLWYEDKNGVKLGLCLHLDFCFVEIPDPTRPLYMPKTLDDPNGNFPDEIFYYAAESIFNSSTKKGYRAVLVQALEGMFFSDAGVIPNDQAVMSRIRIRIDGLIEGETYTVSYPYGRMTFVAEGDAGPGAEKGPGLSMTRDIGLVGPLAFAASLPGDIGPFLIPTNYTGGLFIADGGLTEVTVTGSPLGTNFFRIEGPRIGDVYPEFRCTNLTPLGPNPIGPDDCVQHDKFSVMGRLATRFGARVNRATYSKVKNASNEVKTFVNVWASSVEGQELVATIDGGAALNLTEGVDGNYFGRLQVSSDMLPKKVKVTNISDTPPFSESADITDEVTIRDATFVVGEGLTVTAESSNQVDPAEITAYFTKAQEPRTISEPPGFMLNDQGSGIASGVTTIAPGLVEQPGYKVLVKSKGGGTEEANVVISGTPTTGGALQGVLAISGPDRTVTSNGQTVILNGSNSLGPLDLSYLWTHDDTSGRIMLMNPNTSQASFVTPSETPPLPDGKLIVNFTLTVSDGVVSHSDTMTMAMLQPTVMPVDTCLNISASYRSDKERWVVIGSCDLGENQAIEAWLGNEINPKMKLIGKTLVDEVGFWAIDPGNKSATANGSVPDPAVHTKVHVVSSRGFQGSVGFTMR